MMCYTISTNMTMKWNFAKCVEYMKKDLKNTFSFLCIKHNETYENLFKEKKKMLISSCEQILDNMLIYQMRI